MSNQQNDTDNIEVQSDTSTLQTSEKRPKESKGSKGETYKERSVRIAYQQGMIDCPNAAHFILIKKDGEQYKTVTRMDLLKILQEMKPFVDAKCACERAACKAQWSSNLPGVPQTEWVNPNSYRKGTKIGDKYNADMPPKRVFPLSFSLTKHAAATLHERYPQWIFVSTGSTNHDHPVAHACTQLNTFLAMEALPQGKYLDLHGNPTSNCNFNESQGKKKNRQVHVDTVVQLATAKDYIRKATKWGPEKDSKGNERWFDCDIRDLPTAHADRMAEYDGLLSFHTLYYYAELGQLARLLDSTKGKVLRAIIHKFDGSRGTINDGEQRWYKEKTVMGNCVITQTNIHTNEKYEHPSPDLWFKHKAWAPTFSNPDHENMDAPSLAWTVNKQNDDTYIFTIVSVPKRAAILDPTCHHGMAPVESPDVELHTNHPDMVRDRQTVIFKFNEEQITTVVEPAHFELFDEMRAKAGTKERSHKGFEAFAQMWVVKTKGVMARDSNIKFDSEQLADLTLASYWVDAKQHSVHTSLMNKVTQIPYNKSFVKACLLATIDAARTKNTKDFCIKLTEHVANSM